MTGIKTLHHLPYRNLLQFDLYMEFLSSHAVREQLLCTNMCLDNGWIELQFQTHVRRCRSYNNNTIAAPGHFNDDLCCFDKKKGSGSIYVWAWRYIRTIVRVHLLMPFTNLPLHLYPYSSNKFTNKHLFRLPPPSACNADTLHSVGVPSTTEVLYCTN